MKSKERKDLQTKTKEELQKLLSDGREALTHLQLEHSQGRLKNTRSIFWRRKEIARILSILNRKEIVNG